VPEETRVITYLWK